MNTDLCPVCSNQKKSSHKVCYDCYLDISRQGKLIKSNTNQVSLSNFDEKNKDLPSHTRLYKILHQIEKDILEEIFKYEGWTFKDKNKETEFKVELEVPIIEYDYSFRRPPKKIGTWDIEYCVLSTPDKSINQTIINQIESDIGWRKRDLDSVLYKDDKKQLDETRNEINKLKDEIKKGVYNQGRFKIHIEYKSSINEWGRQIDDYFRQFKDKGGINAYLLSFDERFKEYEEACKRAKIKLIILPKNLLEKTK